MLSVYSGTLLPADKYRNVPMFDAAERAAMDQAEPSRERAQAMYYFDSARELSRARSGDTERYLADVRLLCFTAASAFYCLEEAGRIWRSERDSNPRYRFKPV